MNNEVNEANALLNMELESKLQERVRELIVNDREVVMAIGRILALDPSFLGACGANYEHYRLSGRL